jgi:transposase
MQTAIALGSIIARATFPASERATHSRLIHQSGLGELLDIDFSSTSLNQFYEISDQLLRHKKELEQHVMMRQKQLHQYTNTILLFDLTNTYLEGQAKGVAKAQFGVSKEKRSDCRLITLGLVLNQQGFLSRSEFLPGNVSEPKSLKDAIEALSSTEDLFKPTIISEKLADKLTGRYYLRTNLLHLGAKELWDLYNSIRTVEDAFRFMKSSLGMRPVYHQKGHRVDGHLWITILAYTLIQDVLHRLRAKGITYH